MVVPATLIDMRAFRDVTKRFAFTFELKPESVGFAEVYSCYIRMRSGIFSSIHVATENTGAFDLYVCDSVDGQIYTLHQLAYLKSINGYANQMNINRTFFNRDNPAQSALYVRPYKVEHFTLPIRIEFILLAMG